jgi:hypothetical protein
MWETFIICGKCNAVEIHTSENYVQKWMTLYKYQLIVLVGIIRPIETEVGLSDWKKAS